MARSNATKFGRDSGPQFEKSRHRYDLSRFSVFIYSSFFSLSSLKVSKDPRAQGCEQPWNRGYEDTRSARSEDFQGLRDVFLLSQRAAASSSMDECPSVRARSAIQCNRLEQKRIRPFWRGRHHSDSTKETAAATTRDTSFCLLVSSASFLALKYYLHSLTSGFNW